jgi:tetratricopeptide (TPR) repeat protein
MALSKQDLTDEAIKYFDKALAIDPFFEAAYLYKGNIFTSQKKYDEALDCFSKLLIYSPKHCGAWNSKGVIMMFRGDYKEAMIYFDKALSINPDFEPALRNRENAYNNIKGQQK